MARNCRQGRQALPRTREAEVPARQVMPKTAGVRPAGRNTPSAGKKAQLAEGSPEELLTWIYCNSAQHSQEVEDSTNCCQSPRLGPTPVLPVTIEGIAVKALVDTGCPTTVISKTLCRKILSQREGQDCHSTVAEHRYQMAENVQLSKPSLQLQAYCGTQLPIGAEITLHLQAGECHTKCVALVQEDTPVELLLGTNLMPQLGVQVLDNKGHTLLRSLSREENEGPSSVEQEECLASKEPLPAKATNPNESSECTASQSNQKNGHKLPTSCRMVRGRRQRRASAPANPKPFQGEGH